MTERDYIQILIKFRDNPYEVLKNDKDTAKLMAAVNKSIKLLQKASSRKKADRDWRW